MIMMVMMMVLSNDGESYDGESYGGDKPVNWNEANPKSNSWRTKEMNPLTLSIFILALETKTNFQNM